MDRREFLQWSGAFAASGLLLRDIPSVDAVIQDAPALGGMPMLQNPTDSGVTVLIPVNRLSTAWVEYGSTPSLGQTAIPLEYGLHPLNARIHKIKITGLKPGQPLYYRVHVAGIDFKGPYQIKRLATESTDILRTKTLNPHIDTAQVAFINDTHEKADVLGALGDRLSVMKPDLVFWNGDVFNDVRSDDQIFRQFVNPSKAAFAASSPIAFVSGNHDVHGVHARELSRFVDTPDDLRCYILRQGPVAFVVMDTGEDKPDEHPVYAGLGGFALYRRQQREWLERALKTPVFRSAPYKILVCHIPFFNEWDSPDSREQWMGLLREAGVRLAIHGHVHEPSLTLKGGEVPWIQMIGGGPSMDSATIIEAKADRSQLKVVMRNLQGKTIHEAEVPHP